MVCVYFFFQSTVPLLQYLKSTWELIKNEPSKLNQDLMPHSSAPEAWEMHS